MANICRLCSINFANSRHHLIPKSIEKNKNTVKICDKCHRFIHKAFTNIELAYEFNTIELLAESKRMRAFAIIIQENITFQLKRMEITEEAIRCKHAGTIFHEVPLAPLSHSLFKITIHKAIRAWTIFFYPRI